jgi:hypothetical protein
VETRAGVALEVVVVVDSLFTWDTSMNKSSSAVGFLMSVLRTVVQWRQAGVGGPTTGQLGSGAKMNPVFQTAAAVEAGSPPKANEQDTATRKIHANSLHIVVFSRTLG